ncbi:MAG: hypothetical protein ABFS45_11665 [Pseudomonadota bacterium]
MGYPLVLIRKFCCARPILRALSGPSQGREGRNYSSLDADLSPAGSSGTFVARGPKNSHEGQPIRFVGEAGSRARCAENERAQRARLYSAAGNKTQEDAARRTWGRSETCKLIGPDHEGDAGRSDDVHQEALADAPCTVFHGRRLGGSSFPAPMGAGKCMSKPECDN